MLKPIRYRFPKGRRAPPLVGDKLIVQWGKPAGEEAALQYYWRFNSGVGSSTKRDYGIVMDHFERHEGMFGRTLKDELIERGYDITTFKFTIERLKQEESV